MRSTVQFIGVVVVAVGISGTIDRLFGHPPILGVLTVVNRYVIPSIGALEGYELFVNLTVVVLGAVVVAAGSARTTRARPPESSTC
jgi:hypothetical protein